MLKLFSFLILAIGVVPARSQKSAGDLNSRDHSIDSLRNLYGNHKQFLKEYETVSLIALSYYPELRNERINFKFSSINSTARTTLSFFSIFQKEDKEYIIYINKDISRTGILLDQAPFDAQVAVIAHELAHVMDFRNRSFLEMAAWGLGYIMVKQRTKIERKADIMVVKRGLGMALYDWADFVLNHSGANRRYLKIKKSRYLMPEEILKLAKKWANNGSGR